MSDEFIIKPLFSVNRSALRASKSSSGPSADGGGGAEKAAEAIIIDKERAQRVRRRHFKQ